MSIPSVKRIPWLVVVAFLCLCVAGPAWARTPQADVLKSVSPIVGSSPVSLQAIDSLENGVPLQTSMAARTYGNIYIDVPAGAAKLTITVSNGSGDLDLYVKYGAPLQGNTVAELDADMDYISDGPTADEQVVITTSGNPPLQQGKWYIAVLNYNLYTTSFTLTATYEVPETGLESGVPLNCALGSRRFLQNLFIEVPSDAKRLTIHLADSQGDLDLYVKHGSDVSGSTLAELEADADFFSSTAGTDEVVVVTETTTPPIVSGRWYLAVGNPNDTTVNLTITATYATDSGGGEPFAQLEFLVGDPYLVPWSHVHLFFTVSSNLSGLRADAYVALWDSISGALIFLREGLPASTTPLPFKSNLEVAGQEILILQGQLPGTLPRQHFVLYGALLKAGGTLEEKNFLSNIAAAELFFERLSLAQTEVLARRGNPSAWTAKFLHDQFRRVESWSYSGSVIYTFVNGVLVDGPDEGARLDASGKAGKPVSISPGDFTPDMTKEDLLTGFGEPDQVLELGPAGESTWYFHDRGLSVTLANGKIKQIGVK